MTEAPKTSPHSSPESTSSIELKERPKTRIARFFLPAISSDSALLPSDKWILKTAAEIFKTNKPLQRELVRTALFGAASITAIGAGVALAVATFPVLVFSGISLAAGLGVGVIAGQKTRDAIDAIKTKALPSLFNDIKVRYIKLKGSEVMDAWAKRIDARRLEKNTKAATPPADTAPKSDVKPAADKKKSSASLGAWAFKKAIDGAAKTAKANDSVPPQKKSADRKPGKSA